MADVSTSKGTSMPPAKKSFMTDGPTLHYSHVNVHMFWGLTVLVLRLVAPDWLAGWSTLAVDGGWLPFVGGAVLWAGGYAVLILALRVLRRDDLALLPQLFRRGAA